MISKVYGKLRSIISSKRRTVKRNYPLTNDFSIISCNCVGGLLYHDFDMKFLSPTINLFINTPDFVKLCLNLKYYMGLELEEGNSDDRSVLTQKYPVGKLGDIKIDFLHYHSFEEAKNSWDSRKERINYSKIYVIISDRDNYTEELLPQIDAIPYKKVFFSHINYAKDYCIFVKKDKSKQMVGDLTRYIDFNGHKKYEYYFDFEKWFTGNYSAKDCMLN